ncbi:ATP-binding protein [Rhodanobacter sp. Si-c]|uniref:histidine kinase n=1 Tax=Rhodanobacter lycopersici TaxID=3162487 RepID=A0ABV3QBS8_9GAMM
MKPASLSARVTVLLAIVCLLVLGGGAKLMDWRIDHELASHFHRGLLSQARALGNMAALEEGAAGHAVRGLPGGDSWYELRCDGAATQRSDPPPPAVPQGWPDDVGPQPRFARLGHHEHHLDSVRLSFPRPTGGNSIAGPAAGPTATASCQLLFVQDRHSLDQLMLAIDWILALGPLLAAAIALIAVPLVVRRGLRPIGALVDRMRGIGPNAPGQRLAAIGLKELDPLVARFNDVLGRMDDGLARERQFASGLAHETRTRLAELRALAEVESRYPSGRSTPELLAEIGSIGAELEATVTALLLLTRLQSGLERPQWQALALAPWLERQLQRQHATATARGLMLRSEGTLPEGLHTDPALLEVIVGNLLGNACAYAPAGDTVRLRVDAHGLAIDNAAPGLGDADLASFGQRFWRKQLPHAGHAGLGLALTAAAAQALGLALDFRLDPQQRLHATLDWRSAITLEPFAP